MTLDTEQLIPLGDFGSLKTLLRKIVNRGGDDGLLDDTLAGQFLNSAEQYIVAFCGKPYWLEYSSTIDSTAGSEDITMPVGIGDVINIWDADNKRPLNWIPKAKWDVYIVTPSNSTGSPLSWTKWGYDRRDNAGSPASPYGAMKIKIWPVPSAATTLTYTAMLRPGSMILDTDHPCIPMQFHMGLVHVAAWQSGTFDIGSKAFMDHERIAKHWLAEIRRDNVRNLSGNERMTPAEEHGLRTRTRATPLTRLAALYGRNG